MTPSASARSGSNRPAAVACRSLARAWRSVARSLMTPSIIVAPRSAVTDAA
jgi:hypothetical protein